jgi:hypothetical protein
VSKERNVDLAKWSGPKRPYDLVKEFTIALLVVTLLTLGLAALFSSPDERAVTLQDWSMKSPTDFVATATGELAGTTISAAYGAPYNKASEGLALGPLKIQKWAGVTIPVNPAFDFVVDPLTHSKDAAHLQHFPNGTAQALISKRNGPLTTPQQLKRLRVITR